jgi:hypothetical protein
LAPLAILLIPASVLAGFFLLVFPVGVPESVVLRSHAAPWETVHDSLCIKNAFSGLSGKEHNNSPVDCEKAEFQPSSRVIDAGPLVKLAVDTFDDLGSRFSPEELRQKGPEVLAALREAVSVALTATPPVAMSLPSEPPETSFERRWLVEAIEVAIVEALTLRYNVRNVAVERYVTDLDDARADPWEALRARLANQVIAHRPTVLIVKGSRRGPQAYLEVPAKPWIKVHRGGGELFVQILKGPRPSNAELSLTAKGETVRLSCNGRSAAPSVTLADCAPGFENSAQGTTRLLVVRIPQIIPEGPYSLAVKIAQSGETIPSPVFDIAQLDATRIGANGTLAATVQCLLAGSTNPSREAFARSMTDGARQKLKFAAADQSEAMVLADENGIWIFPTNIKPGLLTNVENAQLWDDDPFAASSVPGDQNFGLMLFPYVARADAGPAGAGTLLEAPLATRRPSPYVDPTIDPSLGVRSPKRVWIIRSDAKPVAYSYARENYIYWSDRILPNTTSPIGWRIDIAGGRTDGRVAAVWHYAVNPQEQGMLLDSNCRPAAASPSANGIVSAAAFAIYDPKYESTRFFSLWATILSAARTSASPDAELALSQSGETIVPPILMDESLRSRIRMRSAYLGVVLVLIGLLSHAAVMVWFRYRSARQ